jgi:hypothetical protein
MPHFERLVRLHRKCGGAAHPAPSPRYRWGLSSKKRSP